MSVLNRLKANVSYIMKLTHPNGGRPIGWGRTAEVEHFIYNIFIIREKCRWCMFVGVCPSGCVICAESVAPVVMFVCTLITEIRG